jgi:UDP-3-O-[3-hydroxymyristoyl] glucosamine N-acyltransferase
MDNRLKRPVRASWLAAALGKKVLGPDSIIDQICSIDDLAPGALAFSKSSRRVNIDGACIVIGPAEMFQEGITLIESDNPRLDFALALNKLASDVGFRVHESPPVIHPNTQIGRNVVVGNGVEIGRGTIIYHNVVISDGVKIGENCLIKSCAVIGEEGYGFEVDPFGRPIRIPHLGSVRIENNVEIGSLTTVCRGTLANTVLKSDCKIDDHVHIAHNVFVGEGAMVIACAEVSGSVVIGAGAWIAPNSSILEKRRIGAGATVGLGAVVIKDVDAEVTVAGNPAKPLAAKKV